MAIVYAFCPDHGPFPSMLMNIQGSATGVTLRNNTELCPQCRRVCKIIEGTFNFRDGVMEIVRAPHWTWEVLETVLREASTAVSGAEQNPAAARAYAEHFADQIASVAPTVSREVRRMASTKTAKDLIGWLANIVGILGFIMQFVNPSMTPEQVEHIVETTVSSEFDRWKQEVDQSQRGNGSASDSSQPQGHAKESSGEDRDDRSEGSS